MMINRIIKLITFIFAIFCCGLGIAVTTQAELGTTPISSLPYLFTFLTPLSFGTTTFLINMLFFLGEILIKKEKFKKTDFFQIIVTIFFGFFIDLGMIISAPFKSDVYIFNLLMIVIGSAILALGISLEVYADISYVPGEGIIQAFCTKKNKEFGKAKVVFDVAQCIAAVILGLCILHKIVGVREGTIIAAILTGSFCSLYRKTAAKIRNKTEIKMK